MDAISLTDFVDFVIKSGSPKLTKVRDVKTRGDYHPAIDFWKPLREGLISFHQGGAKNKKELDKIVSGLTDKKKVDRYRDCVKGYKKFLGNKKAKWFAPHSAVWGSAGVDVRVNPELGLSINGTPHLIKLHFKAEAISKLRIDCVLLLMEQALQSKKKGIHYGVLDVPRWKLHASADPDPALVPLLFGEAASFLSMWQQL